jgi:uncharacterized membrane protein YbhN (UPF0104 family)
VIADAGAPEHTSEQSSASGSRTALQALGVIIAIGLLGLTLRHVDAHHVAELISGLGPSTLLLVIPSMMAVSLETFAWQNAFSVFGARPAFSSLFGVRVASESLGVALPLGALFADAVKPRLLSQLCHTPTSDGLVGTAARKYLLVLSQAGYLFIGFALGRTLLCSAFERACGMRQLGVLALFGGLLLVGVAEGMALSLRGGATFQAILRALGRIPSRSLRARIARFEGEMVHTDSTAARFFGTSGIVRARLALPCLGGWLLEATETWTILHVLGSSLSWGDAVGVEALVVLARNLLAILPGGLGAQEFGYATLLAGAGVDPNTSAAMMLLKRARELVWAVVGGSLLAAATFFARQERATRAAPC